MSTLPRVVSRYQYTTRRGHPLSTPSGKIPVHRIVLYEKIGPGPHTCHHCGTEINWMPGHRTQPGALTVDHLNGDTTDNSPENLVPSCHRCNFMRTDRTIGDEELFIVRDGRRLRAERRVCQTCNKTFLHRTAKKKPNDGMYCSLSCRAKGR